MGNFLAFENAEKFPVFKGVMLCNTPTSNKQLFCAVLIDLLRILKWLVEREPFGKVKLLKPECTYGSSRFDFYLETESAKMFIEVKVLAYECKVTPSTLAISKEIPVQL